MNGNSTNQIQTAIHRLAAANSVLILAAGTSGDGLAAGLALRSFLGKLDKDALFYALHPVSERFRFLPQVGEVLPELDLTKNFVIDVATKRSPLSELSYKKEPERLSIFLKPASGALTAQDISFRSSMFPYDLVVVLGIASFEQLGEFYAQHTDLFFETPVLNIDFRASNENYGQLNLVNLSTTSCSEIILDLINQFESSLIDETIATQLLAGIIAETNSFQHVRTTPQTFLKASQLVSLGANQQEIIGNLYKTKSLGLLKLWGRVLSAMQQDERLSLFYSSASQLDIAESGALGADLDNIIKEMATELTSAKTQLFLAETGAGATGYLHTSLALDLIQIFQAYTPQLIAPQTIKFTVNQPLVPSIQVVLSLLEPPVS